METCVSNNPICSLITFRSSIIAIAISRNLDNIASTTTMSSLCWPRSDHVMNIRWFMSTDQYMSNCGSSLPCFIRICRTFVFDTFRIFLSLCLSFFNGICYNRVGDSVTNQSIVFPMSQSIWIDRVVVYTVSTNWFDAKLNGKT